MATKNKVVIVELKTASELELLGARMDEIVKFSGMLENINKAFMSAYAKEMAALQKQSQRIADKAKATEKNKR